MQIDSECPGGNIVVESIQGDDVHLHQDLRDTAGDWFYWCFRIRNAGGRTLRFSFTQSRALGARGPALSLDEGWTWAWLGPECVQGNAFTCSFADDANDVRISSGMPYQNVQWQRFAASLAGHPHFSVHTLCATPTQAKVAYALMGCPGPAPAHRVVITCRHHACEMMASYVLEGVIQWVAEDADPEARWLREQVQFFIVPLVDHDGVEAGDQGKNRRPRDHGRDYEGASLYSATDAIRSLLPSWSAGRLRAVFDLHDPWIAGPHNEVIYLVGAEPAQVAQEQQRFSRLLESVRAGPLPYHHRDFLPFGEAWNTSRSYAGGKSFSAWSAEWLEAELATAVEIPYANASGVEVNPASARLFGADLGRGVAAYLRSRDSR